MKIKESPNDIYFKLKENYKDNYNSNSKNKLIDNIDKFEYYYIKPKNTTNQLQIKNQFTSNSLSNLNLCSFSINDYDNISFSKQNKIKKYNNQKTNKNSIIKKSFERQRKKYKSFFTKISEDIYVLFKSKLKKEVRDINKLEEDAYNIMISESLIESCENKNISKKKKKVKHILIPKAKENKFKKLDNENDKFNKMEMFQDLKRTKIITNRNINFKSTRTPSQFLEDQKRDIIRRNNNKNGNKKIFTKIQENILPQDSTFILKENIGKNINGEFSNNYNIYSLENILMNKDKSSGFYNIDYYYEEEKSSNIPIIKKKIGEKEHEDSKKVKKERIKKFFNKNYKEKQNDLNHSTSAFITKKSHDNLEIRFLNLYKGIIYNCLGKKIDNDFDINFSNFLLILYKTGFINKNYSYFLEIEKNFLDKQSLQSGEIPDFSISNSYSNILMGKSLEEEIENYRYTFRNDKEFQLSQDAYKIISERQVLDEDINISSKTMFLFYISILDFLKDFTNEKILRKECPFFLENKKLINKFYNKNKYTFKNFSIFKKNAINNLLIREKNQQLLNANKKTNITLPNMDHYNNRKRKYSIKIKNYNDKIKMNKELDDTYNTKLFNQEIKENQFYNSNNNIYLSILSLTQLSNNSLNLLNNNDKSDYSSFSDLNKILFDKPIQKKEFVNDELEIDSCLLEDNNNYFHYERNVKNNNNYNELKSYIKKDEENLKGKKKNKEKKIKYVLEIKIDDKPKKLIINEKDNYDTIKNFCKLYRLNDIETKKIFKIVEESIDKFKL